MSLIERAERLSADIDEIRTLNAIAHQAEAIFSRASQFEDVLKKIRLYAGSACLLQDRGINVVFVIQTQGILHFLRELQEKIADDPSAVLKETGIQQKMLIPIEKAASAIREAADIAWSEYVKQQLPIVGNELVGALSRIPGLRSKVGNFQHLRDQTLDGSSRAPSNDEVFNRTLKLVQQCQQAWKELDAEDIPQEVLVLFREAASSQGADLSSLTPVVLDWLTAHGLVDTLGIRIR